MPPEPYVLERQQWIEAPLDAVFDFFSRAENLGRITPTWLGIRIHSAIPIDMREGARIDYTIRLAGVPVRWRTRIETWEPPSGFVDVSERAPFSLWEHTHRFVPMEGGVLMTDQVRYALPLGFLGRLAHAIAVRASLVAIFDYRFAAIRGLIGVDGGFRDHG